MNREGRAPGRSQAGPRPLGGPADVLVGRGAHLCVAVHDVAPATWADCERVLRAVAEVCLGARVPCQVAVEEMMACGLGVCWTCVVPVIGMDSRGWWNVRSCVEGPVFNGARVWWDRWLGEAPPPTAEEPAPEREAERVQASP